jgi:hypothetical protein
MLMPQYAARLEGAIKALLKLYEDSFKTVLREGCTNNTANGLPLNAHTTHTL